MAEKTLVRFILYSTFGGRGCDHKNLKARTEEEAMAKAALAVLVDPTVTYVLRRVTSRVVGRYKPVAALVKEWEAG